MTYVRQRNSEEIDEILEANPILKENNMETFYLLRMNVCSVDELIQLLGKQKTRSVLVSRMNYMPDQGAQSIEVVDSFNNVYARATFYKDNTMFKVLSFSAVCSVSLYRLLKHLEYFNILFLTETKLEVI